jgi:hypothetical protein
MVEQPLIELKNTVKKFGDKAVNRIKKYGEKIW